MTTEDEPPVLYRRQGNTFTRLQKSEYPKAKTKTRIVRVEVRDPGPIELAVTAMPKTIQPIVKRIMADPQLNEGIEWMTGRWQEFSSATAAIMSGIYQTARFEWEQELDDLWARNVVPRESDEIVVGAGVQAAIYAAMRVRMGFPPPVVIEARDRAGGVFAISRKPSFYLNSRNRSGPLGMPGDPGTALNVIPGGWVQVSDLTSREFIDNTTMAWVVRANLALSGARVVTNTSLGQYDVTYERPYTSYRSGAKRNPLLRLRVEGSRRAVTRRLLWATGLWQETPTPFASDRILTFLQLMEAMDKPFPLKGIRRVAVIGAGDSGKTAVEALTGRGPDTGLSVPALDTVERIDWYGVPSNCTTKERWLINSRSRYKALGALFPDEKRQANVRFQLAPIRPIAEKLDRIKLMRLMDGVGYELEEYDYVIDCTGIARNFDLFSTEKRDTGGTGLSGKRLGLSNEQLQYAIGPAAQLSLSGEETARFGSVSDNGVAIFRYAGRTAQLATILP